MSWGRRLGVCPLGKGHWENLAKGEWFLRRASSLSFIFGTREMIRLTRPTRLEIAYRGWLHISLRSLSPGSLTIFDSRGPQRVNLRCGLRRFGIRHRRFIGRAPIECGRTLASAPTATGRLQTSFLNCSARLCILVLRNFVYLARCLFRE